MIYDICIKHNTYIHGFTVIINDAHDMVTTKSKL